MIYNRQPNYKYLVGIDLGEDFCRISYLNKKRLQTGADPHTFSRIAGGTAHNIPYSSKDILPEALGGQPESLAEFLQNCIHLIAAEVPTDEIDLLMFSCEQMDQAVVDMLQEIVAQMTIPIHEVRFESHLRSFYSYLLMTEDEQKKASILLVDGSDEESLLLSRFSINRLAKPILYYSASCRKPFESSMNKQEKDDALSAIFCEQLEEGEISAVYLMGHVFNDSWMIESLDLILRGRKVFAGDNLYSKGAVYSALIARDLVPRAGKYYYLEENALPWNISLSCRRKRAEVRRTLLEAGQNWYDADVSMECIFSGGGEIEITKTAVTTGEVGNFTVPLIGLPEREGKTTRLRIHLTMLSREQLRIDVFDLGFGEIYPSSGRRWERELSLVSAQEQENLKSSHPGKIYLTVGQTAVNPFYIKVLARNIYTAEELCFSLAQCASFLDESLLDIALVNWLRDECGLEELSGALRQLLIRKAPINEFVAMILLYVGYHSQEEADRIRMEVAAGRGMAPFQRRLQEACFTAAQGRIREAETLMDGILDQLPAPERDMRSEIWNKKGQLRAREFHFTSAAACFRKEWEMSGRDEALVRYLSAMKFSMTDDKYHEFLKRDAELYSLSTGPIAEIERITLKETVRRCADLAESEIQSALKNYKMNDHEMHDLEQILTGGEIDVFDTKVRDKILLCAKEFRNENMPSV